MTLGIVHHDLFSGDSIETEAMRFNSRQELELVLEDFLGEPPTEHWLDELSHGEVLCYGDGNWVVGPWNGLYSARLDAVVSVSWLGERR